MNAMQIVLTIISMLAYSRSHDSCALTIIWSIYLKACRLLARAFNTLHALGITMSHKWTAEAFKKIARTAKAHTQSAEGSYPICRRLIPNLPWQTFLTSDHTTMSISQCACFRSASTTRITSSMQLLRRSMSYLSRLSSHQIWQRRFACIDAKD